MMWEVETLREDIAGRAGQMFQDKIQLDKGQYWVMLKV